MAPPPQKSMDPVNFRAFPPPLIAECSSFGLSRALMLSSGAGLTIPSTPTTTIPRKFLSTLRPSPVTTTANKATHPPAAGSYGPAHTPPLDLTLPELPTWVPHLLAGSISFLFAVTVVLFLVQFPPRPGWYNKIKRWKRGGYEKICKDEPDYGFDALRGLSSAVAAVHEIDDIGHPIESNSLRRRKPNNLSVNTSLASRGLGIVVPGDSSRKPRQRRSYDEETLRKRQVSPRRVTWEAFTEPLPSVQVFAGGQNVTEPTEDCDIETCRHSASSAQISTPDLFDARSHGHNPSSANGKAWDAEPPGNTFLRKINGGICRAADKLSRIFYDHVTDPEEGLLLPVHNDNREKPLTPGIHVE